MWTETAHTDTHTHNQLTGNQTVMELISSKLHNKQSLYMENKLRNSHTLNSANTHTHTHNRGPHLCPSAIKVLVILRQRLFQSSSSPVSSAISIACFFSLSHGSFFSSFVLFCLVTRLHVDACWCWSLLPHLNCVDDGAGNGWYEFLFAPFSPCFFSG